MKAKQKKPRKRGSGSKRGLVGLNRKDYPRGSSFSPEWNDDRFFTIIRIWKMSVYGPPSELLNLILLSRSSIPPDARRRVEAERVLQEKEANARQNLDADWFQEYANILRRIRDAENGKTHDPRGEIVVRNFFSCVVKLNEAAMFEALKHLSRYAPWMSPEARWKSYPGIVGHLKIRLLPTDAEILERCERDADWPKGEAAREAARKYAIKIRRELELKVSPDKRGWAKKNAR